MRTGLTIGSLFSGIGGLEEGLIMAGHGPVLWQVEIDPYCRAVLARHYPEVVRHEDVFRVGSHNLPRVDILCGGFPCQDISSAGKGVGLAGARSGLFFELLRVITELRPRFIVVENVASGAKRWVDACRRHMGLAGYETIPLPLQASDRGAPHRRARIFIVGSSGRPLGSERVVLGEFETPVRDRDPRREALPDPLSVLLRLEPGWGERQDGTCSGEPGDDDEGRGRDASESPLGRSADGLPDRLDRGPWLRERSTEEQGAEGQTPRWPAGRGRPQYDWEPPRSAKSSPQRRQRLRALGNSAMPAVSQVAGELINILEGR